jgi:hypothetical protein
MPAASVRANEISRRSAVDEIDRIDDQIAAALSLVPALQGRRRLIARECAIVRKMLAVEQRPKP